MNEGGTVSVFPGWLIVRLTCPGCGHVWLGSSFVGNVGVECPNCHGRDDDYQWQLDEAERENAGIPHGHDGCWLTGDWHVPEFCAEDDDDDEAEPVRVLRSRAPWYLRIVFFLIGLWVVRHKLEL